ncbi:MAG: phenylalanine--tRNA ligase subunit beta, partial [Verrucomicrobia bacterium]
ADNFKAGDKVPLILPGKTLPAKPGEVPLAIKVGKIRGVESHGMMCSPQELGLGGETLGLLILREDATVGQPFAAYLGRPGSDVIYDLEITPNRPDLNSVIGIAREIAAVAGNRLQLPVAPQDKAETPPIVEQPVDLEGESPSTLIHHGTPIPTAPRIEPPVVVTGPQAADFISVQISDADLCGRYTARIVRGVKIAPSPDWLKNALEKVGVRSINNVVDVTNFVMLEIGQPLHAFDYKLLQSRAGVPPGPNGLEAPPKIVIRRATECEKFKTLDDQERTLTSDMLLIADETKALALAGIMGGQNSEISLSTTDVLLESAWFKPQNIRTTSKKLGLRTESSYRFERGADIGICDWASRRAAQLILETAGGSLVEGVVDAFPKPAQPRVISLRPEKANELLGIELRPEQIESYLGALELKPARRKPQPVGAPAPGSQPMAFQIPTFRVDLKREVDLIEEVARLHGVERIPSTPPRGAIGSNPFDATHDELGEARRILIGLGLFETQGQTLISDTAAKVLAGEEMVSLANPLSSDMNVLRASLLPGLLEALRHNLSRKNNEVGLFELGRVFKSSASQSPTEERHLAFALTGQRNPTYWTGAEREAKADLYDLKGLIEEFFDQFGVRGVTWSRREQSTPLFLESATIQLGRFQLGEMGQLLPTLARRYDLRDAVLLAELNLDTILARRNKAKSFRPLPEFPAIRRDIAMLLPEATTHESVLQTVRQAKPANLESVELFDIFRGKNVPSGQKSMAYAFTYRHPERTLLDSEVNQAHEKLVAQIKERLHAVVRE